jgi:hypothetical protein
MTEARSWLRITPRIYNRERQLIEVFTCLQDAG